MYTGAWVPNWPGETKEEFHVGPHIMIVTPHPEELQGVSRDGQNRTYVTHLPGDIPIYCSWSYRFKLIPGERMMPADLAKAATPSRKSISRRRGGLAETLGRKDRRMEDARNCSP
jgi:hypothetical protein